MTSETEKKIDRYTPAAIEEKWRERWASSGLHNTPDVSVAVPTKTGHISFSTTPFAITAR